jgi:mutator protein MutT
LNQTPPRAAVGAVVQDERGRILLLRRAPDAVNGAGEWTIPGGKIDPGETADEASVRETFEETGIYAGDVSTIPFVTEDRAWGPDLHFVTQYRRITKWFGDPVVAEPHKHDGLRWATPRQIRDEYENGTEPLFRPLVDLMLQGGLDTPTSPHAVGIAVWSTVATILIAFAALLGIGVGPLARLPIISALPPLIGAALSLAVVGILMIHRPNTSRPAPRGDWQNVGAELDLKPFAMPAPATGVRAPWLEAVPSDEDPNRRALRAAALAGASTFGLSLLLAGAFALRNRNRKP